jgi:hypothetical protein
VGLGKYLKKAFLFHWNLLAFGGAMGFALLSGHPDVFVPLVLAGELSFVGLVGTNARFQRSVDIQEHQEARAKGTVHAEEAMERMLQSLPPPQIRRFKNLREHCRALREIAKNLRTSAELAGDSSPLVLDNLQLSGLDRLLWMHLRLLFTQTMLERFFERTTREQIESEIARLEDRLSRMPAEDPSSTSPRQVMRKAVEDNLETSRARLANYQKARENFELIQAEIERLESKINSINEMAINRQDPQFVSSQVDAVADSLVQTEQTINDLNFATGLDPFDDAIPALVPRGPDAEQQTPRKEPETSRPPRRKQTEDGIQYY